MKSQKGQVLLIVVMLLATALTVTLAITFRSTTETQVTKLEEENQKALAAAEAGIEAALREGNIANIGRLLPEFPGFTGTANIETTTSDQFITPLLQKDEQYTFYLAKPAGPPEKPDFSSLTPSYNGFLTVCFGNTALELTIVKQDYSVNRLAINPNPPGSIIITDGITANNLGNCPTGENFANKHRLTIDSNSLLLIARIISPSASTKIGFRGTSNLPLQGKTITSQAKSPAGVVKTVQLFQSYPQIPAEFFVTSF